MTKTKTRKPAKLTEATYFTPHIVRFTETQMNAMRQAWCERWEQPMEKALEGMDATDLFREAEQLGFVDLPDEWHCDSEMI